VTTIVPGNQDEMMRVLATLKQAAATASSADEIASVTARIASISRQYRIMHGIGIPASPHLQAIEVDPGYVIRPHIEYIGNRLAQAVRDVERGQSRHLAVSLPPRAGKSLLISQHGPLWMLRRHPEWKIVMTAHDGGLTSGWARSLRRTIEDKPELGIALARDGGAGSQWETLEKGGVFATSVRGALTGRGARVMIIDDPVKDFVDAHSVAARQTLWDWWLSVAQTRLEPPYLVIAVMTRWHEDDFIGRLFSEDYEGDPRDWEKISLPAIADREDDPLGRTEGTPLLSPLLVEDDEQALARWNSVKRAVGTYTFSAMYQQRPAPAKGAIFDAGWWRFWTWDPAKVTDDGRVVQFDPSQQTGGKWLDSWDCNFESNEKSKGGWVVGQRWVRVGANRFLVAQQRNRWTFTQTIKGMEMWSEVNDPIRSPCGWMVHQRYIEKKANGAAVIDTLRERISGLVPVNPTASKESRARAVTPECESGNVFLPHPGDPGNEWVADLLSELRNFPYDSADDQVDALTQALSALRESGRGQITVPGRAARPNGQPGWSVPRNVAAAALTDMQRPRGMGPRIPGR
jgi:predicted phage terminase large subunit-like protein